MSWVFATLCLIEFSCAGPYMFFCRLETEYWSCFPFIFFRVNEGPAANNSFEISSAPSGYRSLFSLVITSTETASLLCNCYDSYRFNLHPAPTHVHDVSFLTQVWYFPLRIGLIFLENSSQPGKSCRHFLAIQRPVEQLRPLLYSPGMPIRWFTAVGAHFFWKLQNPE